MHFEISETDNNVDNLSNPPWHFRNWTVAMETNASKYDVEMAISERKRVIHEVCNDYRDVLAVEFKIAEISPNIYQEGQIFNTNLGMVVWVTDIGILKTGVEDIFQEIMEKYAHSNLDLMEPCAARNFQEKTSVPPKYEPIEHPDYPGVYYHPRRVKKKCDSMLEISKLPFKILVVCHPLHKLIEFYESSVELFGEFNNFVSSAIDQDYRNSLAIQSWKPLWTNCSVCQEEFEPKVVIKLEHFQQDFNYLLKTMNLTMSEHLSLSILKDSLMALESKQYVQKLETYSKKLTISQRMDLYQILRSDYELFGYDPNRDLLNFNTNTT